MTGPRRECGRTAGLIDRIVEDRVTDDDRRHATTCASCGPILARAARFDDELTRTTRRLVPEDLPRGVLDPGLGGVEGAPRMRGLAPGFASSVAAVAVAVLAIALVLRPGGPGGPASPPPLTPEPLTLQPSPVVTEAPSKPPGRPLKTTGELVVRLVGSMKYTCEANQDVPEDPSPPAERISAVCVSPADTTSYSAAYTVGTTAGGQVVTVTIKADAPEDTPELRDAMAKELATLTNSAFADEEAAIEAGDFVFAKVPGLQAPTPAMRITVAGVEVELQRRANGGYLIHIVLLSPGA